MSADRLVNLIASGTITRETSCDGKRAYRTLEYAEKRARESAASYGRPMKAYFCPFCTQYHVASERAA